MFERFDLKRELTSRKKRSESPPREQGDKASWQNINSEGEKKKKHREPSGTWFEVQQMLPRAKTSTEFQRKALRHCGCLHHMLRRVRYLTSWKLFILQQWPSLDDLLLWSPQLLLQGSEYSSCILLSFHPLEDIFLFRQHWYIKLLAIAVQERKAYLTSFSLEIFKELRWETRQRGKDFDSQAEMKSSRKIEFTLVEKSEK